MCIILAFILFLLPKFNRNDNGYICVCVGGGGLDLVSLPLDLPMFTYQRTSSCASYWLLFYFLSPSSTEMWWIQGGSGPCVPPPGCAHVYLPENIIICIILAFILFLLPKFNRNDNGYTLKRRATITEN